LGYCPKCPGKLVKREIPLKPHGSKEPEANWLAKQGIDYSWGECAIPPAMIILNRIERLRELESFAHRMTMQKSDGALTPEGAKWKKNRDLVRVAIKKLKYLFAKIEVPKELRDEAWKLYEPFWVPLKEAKKAKKDKSAKAAD